MTRITRLMACLLSSYASSFAQSPTIIPVQPAPGDCLTITYPIGPSSALDGREAIYARLTTFLQDGAVQKSHVRLGERGSSRSAIVCLPPQAASFKVDFYTLNKEDVGAAQQQLVYDPVQHRPVQSAYLEALFTEHPDSIFQQEIKAYPANYLAYARYINVLAMLSSSEATTLKIKGLLTQLKKERTMTAGLLSALCVGQVKTGQWAAGKESLLELFEHFPAAPETAFALSIYGYEYYKRSGQEIEADVRQRLKQLFIQYPDGALAGSENVFRYLQTETDVPTAAFERALKPLYATDRVQYHSLTNLPELYLARREHLDSARALLLRGIQRFQDGTINHQYRLTSQHYQLHVPYMLLTLARIDLIGSQTQQAITHASAGLQLVAGGNAEGNFKPSLLALRAQAYQLGGNLNLALADYQQLYKLGHPGALDSLRSLFGRCQLKAKSVEELIGTRPASAAPGSTAEQPRLPNFVGTNRQGKRVSLSDYKQKLVVINVWSTGCGPCIAEMPRLNTLVKQFAHRSDVVFLAVTADEPQRIETLLKKHAFTYQILTGVSKLTDALDTNVLPVHLIVGRQGELLHRSLGARPDIDQHLAQLLQVHL
ncbi:TlpA family protein disulfide reductase [Fibrella forsythiae]|uniref:TlpA family protein disulfide reductase n=1 Tax=Fibrella forsythiae TaxID=2817061 RepID=A0ABS3JIE4_9BACT|nr:TlpA disulfide reductase family protein [Fibrella forsythiae]MBO0949183.1 TlpA family protein disulfide reductase [Fibrella forsythiae]